MSGAVIVCLVVLAVGGLGAGYVANRSARAAGYAAAFNDIGAKRTAEREEAEKYQYRRVIDALVATVFPGLAQEDVARLAYSPYTLLEGSRFAVLVSSRQETSGPVDGKDQPAMPEEPIRRRRRRS